MKVKEIQMQRYFTLHKLACLFIIPWPALHKLWHKQKTKIQDYHLMTKSYVCNAMDGLHDVFYITCVAPKYDNLVFETAI